MLSLICRVIAYPVLTIGVTSCAITSSPTAELPAGCVIEQNELMGFLDSRLLAKQLAQGVCVDAVTLGGPRSDGTFLVVADPVDIQTYAPGQLGRAFGDMFRSEIFQNCKVPIRQVELSKDFSLSQQGMTGLTRNLKDVRGASFEARDAVIATYSLSRNKAYFIARRIDLVTGGITAMTSREVSWQCEQSIFGPNTVRISIR